MSTRYREAKALRSQYENQIIETYDVASTATQNATFRTLFARRYERLQETYDKFVENHIVIISYLSSQPDPGLGAEDEIRKAIEEKYYHIQDCYHTWFPPQVIASPSPSLSSGAGTNRTDSHHIRLPKIPLRRFDGNSREWTSFIQSFDATIHLTESLATIDKFQYLINSLSGEPLNLISALPLAEDNYLLAYQTLTKRYANKRKLADAHWQDLQAITKMSTESSESLRHTVDRFKQNRSALKALKLADNLEDFLWFNLLLEKLDLSTRRAFEAHYRSLENKIPTYEELESFLDSQFRVLETVQHTASIPKKPYKSNHQSLVINTGVSSSPAALACPLCAEGHVITKCQQFLNKTPKERFNLAKSSRLCFNCLKAHSLSACKSTFTCRECKQRHHTLLHFRRSPQDPAEPSRSINATPSSSNATSLVSSSASQVLLATISCKVVDKWGHHHSVRALIDTGSQISFIVSSRAKQLGLPVARQQCQVFGIGNTPNTENSRGVVKGRIVARDNPHIDLNVDLVIIQQICGHLPNAPIHQSQFDFIKRLDLADPEWHIPGQIDILLGADVYSSIVQPGIVNNGNLKPTAVNTIFGWILLGSINSAPPAQSLLAVGPPIDSLVRQFWEIEEIPATSVVSSDDQLAESIFKRDVYRSSLGRFGVSLPFKSDLPTFAESKTFADRRWSSLERRLLLRPSLRTQYNAFMQDYLDSGHMSLIDDSRHITGDCYYIPHHCVVKTNGLESKIRVVFDASAKDANSLSLNDTLLVGPKLQSDISTILLRFRLYPFVFTCDIRQMYRQILVTPDHRRYQLIRFRFSESQPILTYQLNTVTYGVSSSPYLALRTLRELAAKEGSNFPMAAEAINSNLYVDDLVCGAQSIEALCTLKQQVVSLFELGCFELRKWSSNCIQLLTDVPDTHRQIQPSSFESDSDHIVKILGLQWDPSSDSFSFSVSCKTVPCTKRMILSEIARIYDPLGFFGPLSFFAKRLIQHLWVLGLDWDARPPAEVCEQWDKFKSELGNTRSFSLPRFIFSGSSFLEPVDLHGFCDASQHGYAAVVYLRFVVSGQPEVRFLLSKSKVAPLKSLSIPRLELCGAVLLAKLVTFVVRSFKNLFTFTNIYAWTDSTIALAWIKSQPYKWKTFVANRVAQIHEKVPPHCWRHVRSPDNPADIASRGALPNELLSSSLWWAGPSFLLRPSSEWPCLRTEPSSSEDLEEARRTLLVHSGDEGVLHLLSRFSSLRKVQGIVAYCRRWIHRSNRNSGTTISMTELHQALLVLVKAVQSHAFSEEIRQISNGKRCCKQIQKLAPFLDESGILRVGGRITNSDLPPETKHPALLPRKHALTDRLIDHIHERHGHTGINTVVYLLQQNFHIISARRAVRARLANCYRCFRVNPKPSIPPMGSLPVPRVSQVKAFSIVGVDFGGPFLTTMTRSRGVRSTKSYLCLFVCFATKAVHLEIASDLSTETFIAALRRFVARRGRCTEIFSDCGTNFVGANRELIEMMKSCVEGESIQWHFNPPSAPHFGGLWESGIKSVKSHMARIVGQQILTYEELSTLTVQVEAILNSRPLCPLSTDPNDLVSLTPGHFLTLEPLTAPPDPDLSHLKESRLSRWQLIQKLNQTFWRRWHSEYLHTLNQRSKWISGTTPSPINVGTMVVIKDDLAPPLAWKLGRIVEVFPGSDGHIRVASVRTSNGLVKRPVIKLCPLPSQ